MSRRRKIKIGLPNNSNGNKKNYEDNRSISSVQIMHSQITTIPAVQNIQKSSFHEKHEKRDKKCTGQRRVLRYGRLQPGTYVDGTNIFNPLGINITLSDQGNVQGGPNDGDPRRLMVFNSESNTYTGPDSDLINFSAGLGNVLMISDNNMGPNQGDAEMFLENSTRGGLVIIIFEQQVRILSVDLLDISSPNTHIVAYRDIAGTAIDTQINVNGAGDGQAQTVEVQSKKIRRLDIDLDSEGAIGVIRFRECETVCGPTDVPDCNGVCGGTALKDCGGVCYDPRIGELSDHLRDCRGKCYDIRYGPDNVPDCNGKCFNPEVESAPHLKDCAGNCYPTDEVAPHEEDCRGVCGGGAFEDCDGECLVPLEHRGHYDYDYSDDYSYSDPSYHNYSYDNHNQSHDYSYSVKNPIYNNFQDRYRDSYGRRNQNSRTPIYNYNSQSSRTPIYNYNNQSSRTPIYNNFQDHYRDNYSYGRRNQSSPIYNNNQSYSRNLFQDRYGNQSSRNPIYNYRNQSYNNYRNQSSRKPYPQRSFHNNYQDSYFDDSYQGSGSYYNSFSQPSYNEEFYDSVYDLL